MMFHQESYFRGERVCGERKKQFWRGTSQLFAERLYGRRLHLFAPKFTLLPNFSLWFWRRELGISVISNKWGKVLAASIETPQRHQLVHELNSANADNIPQVSSPHFAFCGLKSIVCRTCKNLLLNFGFVAKMLRSSQRAPALWPSFQGKAHLFSQDYQGKKIHGPQAPI